MNKMDKYFMNKQQAPSYLLILFVAGVGAFLAALDVGIINVALPYLRIAFHSTLTTIAWTVTIYTLMLTAFVLLFGKLSDRIGHLRIFQIGIIIFGVASFLCGISTHTWEIITFRTLQGFGASMIQATAVALITTLLPKEKHHQAIGTYGALLGLGNILGTSLGGVILSSMGWSWLFFINIPFCLAVLWGSFKINYSFIKVNSKIDYMGVGFVAILNIVLLLVIEWIAHPGFQQLAITFAIGFVVIAGLFVAWEKRAKVKLLEFKYFLTKKMGILSMGTIAFGASLSIYLIVPALYLQHTSNLQAWQIGLVTFFGPIGYVIMSKLTGKLMHKFRYRNIMMTGELMMFAGMLTLAFMQPHWSLVTLAIVLFFIGMGGGLLFPTNVASIMRETPTSMHGTTAAYNRMVHSFALALGAALAAMFVQLAQQGHGNAVVMSGYQHVWIAGSIINLISFTLFLFDRKKHNEIKAAVSTASMVAE